MGSRNSFDHLKESKSKHMVAKQIWSDFVLETYSVSHFTGIAFCSILSLFLDNLLKVEQPKLETTRECCIDFRMPSIGMGEVHSFSSVCSLFRACCCYRDGHIRTMDDGIERWGKSTFETDITSGISKCIMTRVFPKPQTWLLIEKDNLAWCELVTPATNNGSRICYHGFRVAFLDTIYTSLV